MKWKIKENAPKESISSTNSMSFLTDDALTFHRFSDGSISVGDRRKASQESNGHHHQHHPQGHPPHHHHLQHPDLNLGSTKTSQENAPQQQHTVIISSKNKSSKTMLPSPSPSSTIWTTKSSKVGGRKSGARETNNEFLYITPSSSPANNHQQNLDASSTRNLTLQNGSTAKLMANVDDQPTKQSKCSIFRGILLCLCLNVTYANIVRFPRELQHHGSAFLVPYFVLLIFVGLPIVLLEMALGQFLGQGSAHSWRSSPFFRGASLIGSIASWLTTIWISMQSAIAVLFIGIITIKSQPFSECTYIFNVYKALIGNTASDAGVHYGSFRKAVYQCMQKTIFTPVWENTLYFGLLALGLILIWIISMFSTHSGKVNRRAIYICGFMGLACLSFEVTWHVVKAFEYRFFPEMWPFDKTQFLNSSIWFNALVQVIFSTNIGIGALPVITGKFLYKGDAVRTSIVYICFNVLINAAAVTFYLTQFHNKSVEALQYPELKTLFVVHDYARASLGTSDPIVSRIIPGISYFMIVLSSIISISICIYTSSKIVYRHPTYSMCLAGLILTISALVCPEFIIPRLLDTRIVGTLVICALTFEIISIAWVYGAKNLYTDLEFSIGRPIFKIWLVLWVLTPIILATVLIWWTITYDSHDLLIKYVPRWAPTIFALTVIVILACVEISKEVDYNFMSMIKASTKPSKNWGPGDPLVRHAWKQWRSVCEDTGERDFTLRRRGTRDYTNSIKKGQYSQSRYGTHNRNASTTGSNSPNYSGSIFGDSAIEEDISVDKFSHFQPQQPQSNGHSTKQQPSPAFRGKRVPLPVAKRDTTNSSTLYVRPDDDNNYNSSRIEISPPESQTFRISLVRNPMARVDSNPNYPITFTDNYGSLQRPHDRNENDDHICWRKYSGNSEEFSTEL